MEEGLFSPSYVQNKQIFLIYTKSPGTKQRFWLHPGDITSFTSQVQWKRVWHCLDQCLNYRAAAAAAKSLQSCPTLCNPIDGSPPGSPVPGILQARKQEWGAIAFSGK